MGSLLGSTPSPFTPKHLREAAAVKIDAESKGQVKGVIMDPKLQREGEDDATFFHRLEQEHAIETYFFIMPLHCKPLGTTFDVDANRHRDLHGKAAAAISGIERVVSAELKHRARLLEAALDEPDEIGTDE
jgi:hypothetical protein